MHWPSKSMVGTFRWLENASNDLRSSARTSTTSWGTFFMLSTTRSFSQNIEFFELKSLVAMGMPPCRSSDG